MLQRHASSCSARVAAARGTVVVSVAASITTSRRGYEYHGLHTTPTSQPSAHGETLASTLQLYGRNSNDKAGQYLTGNGANSVWTTSLLTDRIEENHMLKCKEIYFNGIEKYAVDPVTKAEVKIAYEIFSTLDKKTIWPRLFKLFPNLRKPLDEATQKRLENFYEQIIAVADDEAATRAIAAPFLIEMFDTKQISPSYWWRFEEALEEAMLDHHIATSTTSGRNYGSRAVKIVLERATKISYNTFNDWSFASDDFVSPFKFDPIGHRAVHEAGHW